VKRSLTMSPISPISPITYNLDNEYNQVNPQNIDSDLDFFFSNQQSICCLTEPVSPDIFDDVVSHESNIPSEEYSISKVRTTTIKRSDEIPNVISSWNDLHMTLNASENTLLNPSTSYGDLQNERQSANSTEASLRRKLPYNGAIVEKMIPNKSVTKLDVLFGRGKKANNHAGNKSFREIVMRMAARYKNCTRTEKTALSNSIVDVVHKQGGRFLTPVSRESDLWIEMRGIALRKKTSQALRDSAIYIK